jgi:hypothetical protein
VFRTELQVKTTPLTPYGVIRLVGSGFAVLIDYCLAGSLFPTRTAYENCRRQHPHLFGDFNDLFVKLIDRHHLQARMDMWEMSWAVFINERDFKQFAKKPVYARIGVRGARVTKKDLILTADTEERDEESSDEGERVSFQSTNRELGHYFNCDFVLCFSDCFGMTTSILQASLNPGIQASVSFNCNSPPQTTRRICAGGSSWYKTWAFDPSKPCRPRLTWSQWIARKNAERQAVASAAEQLESEFDD